MVICESLTLGAAIDFLPGISVPCFRRVLPIASDAHMVRDTPARDEDVHGGAQPTMSPSEDPAEVTLALPADDGDVQFAARFGVRTAPRSPDRWQLCAGPEGFVLAAPRDEFELTVAPASGALATRLRTAARSQPLPRAFGLHRRRAPLRVVDATAGLCRDAMVLAKLGCIVTAVERVPALALLAADAVRRARPEDGFGERLVVTCGDALALLRSLREADRPDAVYLDPMFATTGSAMPKKEMQACRALARAPDEREVAELFAAAREAARERVVVKRHPDHAPLAPDPDFTAGGARVRFDVYLRSPAER
jgi:16S rRNA (guanine1516-N2)-methyltransferase